MLIIKKLKFPVDEDSVNRVFREVDSQKSGFLNMEEFITGYQMLYTRTFKASPTVKSPGGHPAIPNELVYAVRYGIDELKHHIFEIYSGYEMNSPTSLTFTEKRVYFTDHFGQYRIEPLEGWTLTSLNEEILKDSERNLNRKTKIFWWIDVCMERIEPSRVDRYIANFGLPNDIKFRTMFSQFGIRLPRDSNGHMYAGNGSSPTGSVSSLSFFYHALWISSVPVVYHLPSWIHKYAEAHFNLTTYRTIRHYYDTRFAFFFSSLMESPVDQQRIAYEGAQSLGDRLFEEYDFHPVPLPKFSVSSSSLDTLPAESEKKGLIDNPGDSSIFTPPILDEREDQRDDIPIWLQSGAEMKATTSRMNYETISFHILDPGFGATAILTFREADLEINLANPLNAVPSPTEIYSSGVLGRLLCSIRRKILENMCNEGVTALAGDITDCPMSLMSMIITLVSNFSMNTLGPLHAWKKLVDSEVDDVAVSKHVDHCTEMKKISSAIKVYVDQTTTIFTNLFSEAAVDRTNESLLQNFPESQLDNQFDPEPGTKLFTRVWGAMKTAKKLAAKSRGSTPLGAYRRPEKISSLPPGAEDLPIHFELIQNFLGQMPCTYLKNILYGDEHLELKGLLYWSNRMNDFNESVGLLEQKIQYSLEEKRNFFSYLLSVVTIFLGPLTVLTGYWGMNFDNMHELATNYYPLTPGVKLLWAVGYVLYGVFLILAIHYRFLYSAT